MKKLILANDEYKGLVQNICRNIAVSDWRPDYVVGITRGGLLPAVMISHYFKVPCQTLKVSLRESDSTESNLWMSEDAFGAVPYEDRETYSSRWDPAFKKNILIVDDINDSGETLNWIIEDWQSSCFPKEHNAWNSVWNKSTRFAVVVDNLASGCKVKMDYVGKEINKLEDDVWVEFPYERWWL